MFTFSMTAEKYFRNGFIEIRMRFKFDHEKEYTTISEIVDEERFSKDARFAKSIIDNLFDRSRREVFNQIETESKGGKA